MHFLFHCQWPKITFVSVTENDMYLQYAAHIYPESWEAENLECCLVTVKVYSLPFLKVSAGHHNPVFQLVTADFLCVCL